VVSTSPGTEASMEQVIALMVELRTAIIEALAARFGPREWQVAPNVRPFSRSAADDDRPGAETVSLGTVYFAGTYPHKQWRRAADVVARTGEAYGFDELLIHVDGPEGISFAGRHRDGHLYRFGIGATTVLSVRTGAALWAGAPYRNAAQIPQAGGHNVPSPPRP